uniref:Ras domain containing protein n=1 Tax=Haemonchus contortus TaxID=6289 RepID=A0A7I4YC49_HAECO
MSGTPYAGVPTIPPAQFSTFATTIDPPRPLPDFVSKPQIHPTTTVAEQQMYSQVAVPYPAVQAHVEPAVSTQDAKENKPTTVQESFAITPNAVNDTKYTQKPDSHHKKHHKLPLAPTSSKCYNTKRTFKVIIVGDAGVGVDFRERSCVIERELLKVQLWDTAGQERYRHSIVAHYYRNVNAVVFVYDVTSPSSFASLRSWISECERNGLTADCDVPRILIGNKCDLKSSITTRVDTDAAQSEVERQAKEQERLVLKASEAKDLPEDGWCC